MAKGCEKMTPEEQAKEWSNGLWKCCVINKFKKLDKKTKLEVEYYFTLGLREFIQRCIRCSELRNNSLLLDALYKNATDIIEEFQEADEIETEEK